MLSAHCSKALVNYSEHCALVRVQLKEYKARETSLSCEVSELERENVELEAQIAQLRRIQLDADAQRHENARLQDELALLGAQLDDLAALKVSLSLSLSLYRYSRENEVRQSNFEKQNIQFKRT